MKLGDIELIPIVENSFKLDGGSMFGIVPKIIWSKLCPSDENNLVSMDINPLIIKTGKETLVIDTGFGDTLNEQRQKMYALSGPTRWDDELARNGLKPGDITGVIFTHAHADHAMGALKLSGEGKSELRFPNARYYIQKREWRDANNPNERTVATYMVDKLRLIQDSGKLELLEGDGQLFPGISVKLIGGHTPGMQAVMVDSGGQRVIYPGDLMPLTAHMKIAYVAAVDLDPITTMAQKRWLHERMLKDDWILAFDHDIVYKFAKFKEDQDGKVIPTKI
jgi:glyoxylase-like metal-dependent hydrolase (beta-lactamase superfamily II)